MRGDDTASSGLGVSKEGRVPGKKECLTVSHAAKKSNSMHGQCPLFSATWLLKSESCFREVLWGGLIPLRSLSVVHRNGMHLVERETLKMQEKRQLIV